MSDKRFEKNEPPPKDDKDDPRNRLNLVDEYKPPPRPNTATVPPESMVPPVQKPADVAQPRLPNQPLLPGQPLAGPRVDLVGMAAALNPERLSTQSVDQLAQMYLIDPERTRRSVDQVVASEKSKSNDFLTDMGAAGIGLVTKFGVDKVLTRGPGWTRPIGFVAGAFAAGLSKDLLTDGQLGNGTDWLRGAGVYGGSVLLIKGMALNPSRATLGATTLEGLTARTGVTGLTGTSAQVSEQLLIAGAGGSKLARVGQYLNPMNYTGLTWNNGLRVAGIGGQTSAALVAEGGMSVAQFNARRNIGQFATRFGSAYAFGAGREGLYIGTGQTTADGGNYDLTSAVSEMNLSGLKLGTTAALLLPALGTGARVLPGGARLLDTGAAAAGRFGPTGAVTLEALLPAAAAGSLRTVQHQTNAAGIEARAAHARALVDQAKADEKLRGR